jgi:hypothetical protein
MDIINPSNWRRKKKRGSERRGDGGGERTKIEQVKEEEGKEGK